MSHNHSATNQHVYVRSEEHAWVPARLLETSSDGSTATVSIPTFEEQGPIGLPLSSSNTSSAKPTSSSRRQTHKTTLQTCQLSDYPSRALPLQNIDTRRHSNNTTNNHHSNHHTTNNTLSVQADMVDLPYLHEAAILYNLKARHVTQHPYTRTGDIVIAVNPYQWLHHLYTAATQDEYAQRLVYGDHDRRDRTDIPEGSGCAVNDDDRTRRAPTRSWLEPHVYETSCAAYRGLALDGLNQSILVSGESGAGKTETVKILLSDLARVQQHQQRGSSSSSSSSTGTDPAGTEEQHAHTHQSPIVQRVLDSNPLLEAFGNAQTVRNDNSSRFGKYLSLQFECDSAVAAAYANKALPGCVLAGSVCDVYLLEKSRVVRHEPDERTYHVFYQLLAASNDEKCGVWEGLDETDVESFKYVGYTETTVIEGLSDAERYAKTIHSLELVGVTGDRLRTLLRSLCIVLQLGNLGFETDSEDEAKSVIDTTQELDDLSSLMGVAVPELLASLTVRTVTARNESFQVPLSACQAKDSCDAFAKEIYAKAFLWLVRQINDATCAELNYKTTNRNCEFGTIGLLDIFGFESFETNRFEQLCINYANEKLQQKFTQDIFRSVQAEYEFEGIELEEITYDDNTDVLDLVEGRMGLVAFLNEECVRPGGSDKGFVAKAAAMNKDNACFVRENGFDEHMFGVNHYAGPVIYDASGFTTKNMDTLATDLHQCARKSSNDILSKELTNDAVMNVAEKKRGRKPPPQKAPDTPGKRKNSSLVGETVWTKFKTQLTNLMTNLKTTRTRYIRCIKPNKLKKPLIMDHVSTVEQLRCAGVVAAVTISRSAFPNRLEHDAVLDRFKALWSKGAQQAAEEKTLDCEEDPTKMMVDDMLTESLKSLERLKEGSGKTIMKAFVMGKSRTYFRAGALEFLENERLKCLSRWAVDIQRTGRMYNARTRYLQLRRLAISLEALTRMRLTRRKFLRNRRAAVRIECWHRCLCAAKVLLALRRNYRATILQSRWRTAAALSHFKVCRLSTIVVQRIVRGALQRPKYRVALHEKKEEAKLENQVVALQRKLEEAEMRRVEAEKQAEEKTRQAIEKYKGTGSVKASEEKKDEEKSIQKDSVASSLSNPDEPKSTPGFISEQQQTLMDESGKMLEYLRKEVFKLRSHNSQLRTDFDLLKDNNQRLMDANASAGASFAALNQHAKQLSKANDKVTGELQSCKQQVQKLSITQLELKEELKMKQASYVAEVHSRLQYSKALSKIVDVAQDKCRDDRLVEQFLRIADSCEAEYMHSPTSLTGGTSSLLSTPTRGKKDSAGLMSGIRSLWS